MPKIDIETKNKLKEFFETEEIRENLFNWCDFKEESNILFIGNDVYKSFAKNNNKITVLSIDGESRKDVEVDSIVKDTLINFAKGKENVFDYIIVSGEMERLNEYVDKMKRSETLKAFFEVAHVLLKDTGVLLFPVLNKFSIKNFSGATYNGGAAYDVLLGREKNSTIYSKNEIDKITENSSFKYRKYYYPFPDHKLPSIIYSSDYLPNGNNSKLNYLIYFNPEDTILFNELEAMHEVAKDGMLEYFANSFLVELSNTKESLSKANFISFNNFRNDEDKLITKMYDEYVQKQPVNEKANGQIEKIHNNLKILEDCGFEIVDSVNDGVLRSKLQKSQTLNEYIGQLVSDEEVDLAKDLIDKWYKRLQSSMSKLAYERAKGSEDVFTKYEIEVSEEMKDKMNFLSDCLFDFIFENVFVEVDENNEFTKFIPYDQEWNEQNAPFEFIVYRALKCLFEHNSKISKYIAIEELFEKYEISEFISVFDKLEAKIQESLLNRKIADSYALTYVALTTVEGLNGIIDGNKEAFDNYIAQTEENNAKFVAAIDSLNESLRKYRRVDLVYNVKRFFNKK